MQIVVATDGGTESGIATAVADKLPIPRSAEFAVAMVIPTLTPMPTLQFAPDALADAQFYAADAHEKNQANAHDAVGKVVTQLESAGHTALPQILEGNPAETLLELIEKRNADLVLTGVNVDSNFVALFLGSVSRKLVLYSKASVLIGRHFQNVSPEDTIAKLKEKNALDIVIGTDGSNGANLAIESLEKLPRKVFGTLTMVAIDDTPFAEFGEDPVSGTSNKASSEKFMHERASQALDRVKHTAERAEIVTGFGRPSKELGRIAQERSADVIFLGANRHGALERLVLGSCAYETATHAHTPVLIFRNVLGFE